MRRISHLIPYPVILLLLISPALAMGLPVFEEKEPGQMIRLSTVALLFFLIPLAFFYKNVRLYCYCLLPLIVLTPLFLFSTFYFGVPPGFELIAFILQTNPREAAEAIGPFLVYFIPIEIFFVGLFLFATRKITPGIPPVHAIAISGCSFLLLCSMIYVINGLSARHVEQINRHDLVLKYDYPFTLISGINEARVFLNKNHLRQAEDFTFRAVKGDSLTHRQVYVLVIGESSRYDRWQVNGYHRATSPRLAARQDLLSFSDVIAGAHYTWVSVPQIITRATPDNYDLQYREKSILQAFRETGFKTVWLSNQSDQDIFWSGSITLHAKTADVSFFSPTYSPNLEFERIHDGRLLPLLDSMLRADNSNLFIVMHTMGNHWEYSQRYPEAFDKFKPSGYTQTINPPNAGNREAVLNSYDNSILYADFILDSVLNTVNRHAEISAVTYISDHGEDLFDAQADQIDFHFRPSAATLHVPLFVWTSDLYKRHYPEKQNNLEAHVSEKIGAENIFYTLADMAHISVEGFDSKKSIAHRNFQPSLQKYYGDDKRACFYKQLEITAHK
ncbi:MAG: phosphoethanolamine transferase [Chryseosolibacter sp.]